MATEKFLRVTMPDGSKWDVPALLIAESRAAYYATVDSKHGIPYTQTYHRELAITLDEDDEILSWAANYMNWQDVVGAAVKVDESLPPVDYQHGWCNGDKEIVEREALAPAAEQEGERCGR